MNAESTNSSFPPFFSCKLNITSQNITVSQAGHVQLRRRRVGTVQYVSMCLSNQPITMNEFLYRHKPKIQNTTQKHRCLAKLDSKSTGITEGV